MTGMPTPVRPLDITNRRHSERVIAAASSIRTRRTPSSFAAICLIDSIQRERAAMMASLHYDEATSEQESNRILAEGMQRDMDAAAQEERMREVYDEPYHGADETDLPSRP